MGWTRNYYNLLTAFLLGDTTETSVNTPVDYQPPIVVRKPDGTYTNVLSYGSSNQYTPENPAYSSYRSSGLRYLMELGKCSMELITNQNNDVQTHYASIGFGTGSTPATYEDYRIETLITSGLTGVNSSGTLTSPSSFDAVTHKYSSTRTFTINNSSGSSITLSEMGIFCNNVLVYREVLATPITIDPGESVTVSFTREATVFNYTPYT